MTYNLCIHRPYSLISVVVSRVDFMLIWYVGMLQRVLVHVLVFNQVVYNCLSTDQQE